MHCSKHARTSKRSFSIDQPTNHTSVIGPQMRLCVSDFVAPSNHAVSQNRLAIEAPPHSKANVVFAPNHGANDFGKMSRAELEVFAQTKTIESDSFKYHFKLFENKCNVLQTNLDEMKKLRNECNVLQTSLGEMKALYSQANKRHVELKRYCQRFILDAQRIAAEDDFAADMYTSIRSAPPAPSVSQGRVETVSINSTENRNNNNKRRRTTDVITRLKLIPVIVPEKIIKSRRNYRFAVRTASKSNEKGETNTFPPNTRLTSQTQTPSASSTLKTVAVPATDAAKPKLSDATNTKITTVPEQKLIAVPKPKTIAMPVNVIMTSSPNLKSSNSPNVKTTTTSDTKSSLASNAKPSSTTVRVRTSLRSKSPSPASTSGAKSTSNSIDFERQINVHQVGSIPSKSSTKHYNH